MGKKNTIKKILKKITRTESGIYAHHKYCIAVIVALILALVYIVLIYPKLLKTKAVTSSFIQTDWSGGSGQVDMSDVTKYYSSSNIDSTTPGQLSLLGEVNHRLWTPDIGVSPHTGNVTKNSFPRGIAVGDGSHIISWKNDSFDIMTQRVFPDGTFGDDVANGSNWPAGGYIISGGGGGNVAPQNKLEDVQDLARVSDGTVFTWTNDPGNLIGGSIYVQKIKDNGQIKVRNIVSDGDAAWDNTLPQVNYTDNKENPFPNPPPISLSANGSYPRIISTPDNKVIVFWLTNDSGYKIRAQIISADGIIGTVSGIDGWPGTIGSSVDIASGLNFYNDGNYDLQVTSDGVIVSWLDITASPLGIIKAKKIKFDGTLDWSGNTIDISSSAQAYSSIGNFRRNINFLSFGSDSFVALFNCASSEALCAQIIDNSGNVGDVGNWGINGIGAAGLGSLQDLPPNPVISGGALYIKFKSGNTWYIQKINSDGSKPWASNISFDSGGDDGTIYPDGNGGIFAVYGATNLKVRRYNSDKTLNWSKEYADVNYQPNLGNFAGLNTGVSGSMETIFIDKTVSVPSNEWKVYLQKIGNGITSYPASGTILSSIFDAEETVNWDSLDWTGSLPDSSMITIETRSATGYPGNLALNKIASASSYCLATDGCGVDLTPSLLTDNNNIWPAGWANKFTASAGEMPQWASIDLGTVQTVGQINLNFPSDLGGGAHAIPKDYKIQTCINNASCDPTIDSDWVDQADIINNSAYTLSHTLTPVQTRKIRIYITANDQTLGIGYENAITINEIEVYSGASWSCEFGGGCVPTVLSNADGSSGSISMSSLDLGRRYFQYKITMTSGSTPTLTGLTVNYTPASSPPPPNPPSAYTIPPPVVIPPETPPEPIAETQPVICFNTLNEVQLSPIPPFDSTWGLNYPWGDRVRWALDHRANIFNLYVALLQRQPCAVEVNWVLQHDNDIFNIRYNILISEEYRNKQ